MKVNRKRWKFSDDKKPTWNRAKVSIGAAGLNLSSLRHPYPEIYKNPPKSTNPRIPRESLGNRPKCLSVCLCLSLHLPVCLTLRVRTVWGEGEETIITRGFSLEVPKTIHPPPFEGLYKLVFCIFVTFWEVRKMKKTEERWREMKRERSQTPGNR